MKTTPTRRTRIHSRSLTLAYAFTAFLLTTRLGSVDAADVVSSAARYQLLPDSHLIDDCPPCARPTVPEPMRGSFDLRLVGEDPLFSRYALENIAFTAGGFAGRTYKVTGRGAYKIGGEVALIQELSLEVRIDDGVSNRLCFLTNAIPQVGRLWPMIEVPLIQTNGTFTQAYELHLFAAPFWEVWFSTAHGMTPGIWDPSTNRLTGGDLLSSAGHVVRRNRQLTVNHGIMPLVPDLGLDAADILPGGEIAFSITQDAFSETLGNLYSGDVLSDQGRVITNGIGLVSAFTARPPTVDIGLDALQVMPNYEFYFSVANDLVLGQSIRRGDLLSSRGFIVRSNEQLVARFHPIDPQRDYGLDAIYVWPSGEVWFSVETGFYGQHFELYGHGDLLSDQGYVVARNLELVGPFQPLEDLADFGLDALFIVADASAAAPAPHFTRVRRERVTGSVELEWEGKGRLWQVLRAGEVMGPFDPVSEILPDRLFNDTRPSTPRAFYQLKQW